MPDRRTGSRVLCAALLGVLALLLAAPAPAATLLGVFGERSAGRIVEAAHRHLAAHPGDRLVLRTSAQIAQLDDATLAALVRDADAVLAVAVFGEPARRLAAALADGPAQVLAFNGEAALNRLTRQPGADLAAVSPTLLRDLAAEAPVPSALAEADRMPLLQRWLAARGTWRAGGSDNLARLLAHALDPVAGALPPAPPEPDLMIHDGQRWRSPQDDAARGDGGAGPTLVVLDLATADPLPAQAVCNESRHRGMPCVALFARWGEATRRALAALPALLAPARPAAIVLLQDFVAGGADGREQVTTAFEKLNVPVLKAIRLTERSSAAWQASADGLPADSVQYRLALPELQGSSQPLVIAAAGPAEIDPTTGIALRAPQIVAPEIRRLVGRALRWRDLAAKPPAERRLAIVYYNHPPGRQNIGADNLDVPASLFEMLNALKSAGYDVGTLPPSPEALLDLIMARGVNLPEDRGALREMAPTIEGLDGAAYGRWFATLPAEVRAEMRDGPLGRLHAEMLAAEAQRGDPEVRRLAIARAGSALKELHHLASGVAHAARDEALALLERLQSIYPDCLSEHPKAPCAAGGETVARLTALGIEGMRGWGEAPGYVMVENGRMLIPGLRFGKVFIGPQPPRGWQVNEELLHANTSVPPPHQYLGFYHWLRDEFRADALVHVGRHSTYEFLPGKSSGLSAADYPSLIADELPVVYPYIVDGVGEGLAAKRRGLAVMVDHLTPPIASTPLYDKLLELRQLVESFEAATSATLRAEAARGIREKVVALDLRAELEASMADVLRVRGIGFEQADDQLLAHEVGHYLTKLQERFMPYGLHVFGRPWTPERLALMEASMRQAGGEDHLPRLADSPAAEMAGLLNALAGGFVPPGKGNDPLRSPDALPTGRNFHGVDGDLLPTRLGFGLGESMAAEATARVAADDDGSEAVILWASDAVRDEGVMVGFSLALMGARPVWNARGIVTGVRLDADRPRRDVVLTTSGLFRDLYPNLLQWLDHAARQALAAAGTTIVETRPALAPALRAALAPLDGVAYGRESLASNALARRWIARTEASIAGGASAADAGRGAALRIFGDAPGTYGAGVNTLAERSGGWRSRDQIGQVYLGRMGHGYGLDSSGEPAHAAFEQALAGVARSYHGRASHLYGLLDNNDAFDYLGGLSLAAETLTGRRPQAAVLQHASAGQANLEPLAGALLGELRGRYLNPAWIKPLMAHGYAGARTMGQEFLENLWGWQVTRPDLVQSRTWDEVRRVYFDDGHKLGLPEFLAEGHQAHVKAQMLAIFMVAAQRGYWQADAASIRQLGGELARLVAKNGLPGSGHAAPDHPMWDWLSPRLAPADAAALGVVLARARGEEAPASTPPPAASEAAAAEADARESPASESAEPAREYELIEPQAPAPPLATTLAAAALLLLLFAAGVRAGRHVPTLLPGIAPHG